MAPSFSITIPNSFVIDREGHVAFIGHPMQLYDVFPKIVNGTWRTSDEAKAADAARIAEAKSKMREKARMQAFWGKLGPASKAQDSSTTLWAEGGRRRDAGRRQRSASARGSASAQNP
ncbi:hypothetical protein [Bradyrhizobium sp. WU425]|uniref:hypothetical protein n=1 Tax=Bradyrhizobium sp. WU425 TaxID=187029 RepID=UPI001E495B1D|nr:hypothetical protein [Bradyrhizobium canariense]UFW71387.1 hypothetical protein BcanWU425_32885 [Bradyrhizobium canariense]